MTLTTLYDENLYEKLAIASYWEASAPPPPKDSGPLTGAQSCEVAVIGGGFCGLSAGYHLAKDHGRVLDAILRGDSELAQHHMIEHITIGGKGFAEFVSTLPSHMFESHEIAYPLQTEKKQG